MTAPTPARRLLLVPVLLSAVFAGGAIGRVQDLCGPFTDVSLPSVLRPRDVLPRDHRRHFPDNLLAGFWVTRGQAAVFVSKGVNQAIARSSRRAALGQWWTTQSNAAIGRTTLPGSISGPCVSDGADVWVSSYPDGNVFRVRASDGRFLETWSGARFSYGLLSAMGEDLRQRK